MALDEVGISPVQAGRQAGCATRSETKSTEHLGVWRKVP